MPQFVKRFFMSRPLSGWLPPSAAPSGLFWQPWADALLETHAGLKYLCFVNTVDADVFPNLATLTGCRWLMNAVCDCNGFCPAATWLLTGIDGPVGCIQGIIEEGGVGAIQNIGVLPAFRRHGFGALLVAKALSGFRDAGATVSRLEVTAGNPNALRLYRRLGFRTYNTHLRRITAMAGSAS